MMGPSCSKFSVEDEGSKRWICCSWWSMFSCVKRVFFRGGMMKRVTKALSAAESNTGTKLGRHGGQNKTCIGGIPLKTHRVGLRDSLPCEYKAKASLGLTRNRTGVTRNPLFRISGANRYPIRPQAPAAESLIYWHGSVSLCISIS
jgi:hypothetical protein